MTSTSSPLLIPRHILFGNPLRSSPQISPDGKYLAYLAPNYKNVIQVWLRNIGQEDDRILTNNPRRGIQAYFWTYKPGQLIYLQDSDGDENFHLYLIDTQANIEQALTPLEEGVKAQVIALHPEFPDEILIGLNISDRHKFDIYRLNLKTGKMELDTENPGNFVHWTTNSQFQILAALATRSDGGYDLLYRKSLQHHWKTLRSWTLEERGGAVSFSSNNQTLYILGTDNANAQRLIAIDLMTERETIIAQDEQYDVGGVIIHPTYRNVQAVYFYKERLHWQLLDESIKADFEVIAQGHSGDFFIVSRDLLDETWIIAYVSDDSPVCYYLYQRPSKVSTFIFSNRPELEGLPLVPMQPISYQARDGLTIHGYLTLPISKKAPYAIVLLVHGGPWSRDTWGCNMLVQWLANRGYGVLQVNFRGSTGYGKAFLNAGNRQWGAAMQDDLIDGVSWLVNQGIAEPSRIAIMGISYGGYATLVGLTFTPDMFACGVDMMGPSNLVTFMRNIPPYWKPLMTIFKHRIGNVEIEEEFLKTRSPLFFVNRIQKPLLIAQGANDVRVKQSESEQIVEAMYHAGKKVTYVLYNDEGHGFIRPENRLHFYAITEEFLAKYLGGQFEPMGTTEPTFRSPTDEIQKKSPKKP